jgi:effector-binding domain-containing protein
MAKMTKEVTVDMNSDGDQATATITVTKDGKTVEEVFTGTQEEVEAKVKSYEGEDGDVSVSIRGNDNGQARAKVTFIKDGKTVTETFSGTMQEVKAKIDALEIDGDVQDVEITKEVKKVVKKDN